MFCMIWMMLNKSQKKNYSFSYPQAYIRNMKKIIWTLGISVNIIFQLSAQSNSTPFNQPPEWSKHVIWYQVFLERFYNGDKSNDPKPENINTPPINSIA